MGALRVDLDALKGPPHGPSVRFFASFYRSCGIPESFLEASGPTKWTAQTSIVQYLLSRVSLERMWTLRIESMIRVLIFKCMDVGAEFRFLGKVGDRVDGWVLETLNPISEKEA